MNLRNVFRRAKEGVSAGLDPAGTTPTAAPVPTPIIENVTTAVAPAPAPIVPEETPEEKLYKKLKYMDADTLISQLTGEPRLPADALMLSKMLDNPTFLKWLKIHVLNA